MSDRTTTSKQGALALLEFHAAADDNADALNILRWVRALIAQRDTLAADNARLRGLVRQLADKFERMGLNESAWEWTAIRAALAATPEGGSK